MNKKRIVPWVLGVIMVFLVSIWGYSRVLQNLVNESGRLFDDRCNNVSPTLIAYKNSYLRWRNLEKEPDKLTNQKFMDGMNEYVNGVKAYIPLEESWLKRQSEYINRWDFRLFMPKYMKDLAQYQLEMFQSYRNQAMTIIQLFETADNTGRTEPPEWIDMLASKKMLEASDKYFAAYDEDNNKLDWRKLLWKPPPINCPDENLIIPDTSIDKIFPSSTPTPTNNDVTTSPNG